MLENPTAFYTVNRLLDGSRFAGPFRPLFAAGEGEADGLRVDLAAGKRIFQVYCMACHQADGRGGGLVPDFVGDKTRLAKGDAELVRTIRRGIEESGMPPFDSILSESEIRDVLGYIRDSFDPQQRRR